MRIILLRHGETQPNTKRIVQGYFPYHLTERGKIQAQNTGKHLSKKSITKIYCSDLIRARETATEIQKFVKAPVSFRKWLRGMNPGEYQGKPKSARRTYVHEKNVNPLTYKPKGGESLLQFRSRVLRNFERLLRREKSPILLIITHGSVIVQLLRHLIKFHESEIEKYDPTNCAMTIVDVHQQSETVPILNSTEHLTAP